MSSSNPAHIDCPPPFRIADALAQLEQQFTNPSLQLSSIASDVELSPAYLARLLKASTGLTFLQHLRRHRVKHAERLLLTTMMSIKEIGAECGYNSSGSFGRDFRRVHRCTPGTWRGNHRTRAHRTS